MQPVPRLSPKVDVLVLYTQEAWSKHDITKEQLEDKIILAYVSVNQAMENSKINLEINLRHVEEVKLEHARQHGTLWWCFCLPEAMRRCLK